MRQVLAWAIKHDAPIARRLADALGWWWWLRGRLAGQYRLLREVAGSAEAGSEGWCAVQSWLGWAAFFSADESAALGHFTAVLDAVGARGASRVLADALAGRAVVLLNTGRLAEGTQDGRRSLAMARELGYRTGEGIALGKLAIAASYSGDNDGAIGLIRQQEQFMADIPGSVARGGSSLLTGALIDAGDLPAAETVCATVLARCRDAGDAAYLPIVLMDMADLDIQAGRFQDAAHLREGLQAALRTGNWKDVAGNGLWYCALLCTATGRYAEAATAWAAHAAHVHVAGGGGGAPSDMRRHEEGLSKARQALGPDRTRAAEERGAAMSMDIAAQRAAAAARGLGVQPQDQRVEFGIVAVRGSLADLGEPVVGDGPAGRRQPAGLVHLPGRVLVLGDEPVVLGVPVQATQRSDHVLGGAAPAAGIAAGYDVGPDVGHQLPDLGRGNFVQPPLAPVVDDAVPVRAVRPAGAVGDGSGHHRDVLGEGRHRRPVLRDGRQVIRRQAHLPQHQQRGVDDGLLGCDRLPGQARGCHGCPPVACGNTP